MKRGLKRASKKALSPVIASVLLIALVLVLASIIFLWARGFVSEQIEKFGKPIETLCEEVEFDAEFAPGAGGGNLDVVNRGNIRIYGFDIKEIEGGNSKIESFNLNVEPGDSLPSQAISLGYGTEKIIIYPRLLGNVKGKKLNRAVTCIEKGKTINIV